MKNLLDNVNEIDELIRQHQKMESKMRAGQWIDAWRDCNRIIAFLNKSKQDLIKSQENTQKQNKI